MSSKHGMSNTPTYKTWEQMIQRCTNTNVPNYLEYGAVGINVCSEWLNSFLKFYEDMGERPEGKTINRINGAKIYSKETCEWADLGLQSFDIPVRVDNTSKRTGVYWDKIAETWYARIGYQKKLLNLGHFSDFNEAVKAREAAEMKYYGFIKN